MPKDGWVAFVEKGRLVALARASEAPESRRRQAIALPPGVIAPGFWDCHVHVASLGAAVRCGYLAEVASVEGLVARASELAAARGERAGLHFRTPNLEARCLGEGRLPTAADLDRVKARRPLVIADVNKAIGNTAALRLAGLASETGHPAGIIERDASGSPTGVAWFGAKRRLERAVAGPSKSFEEDFVAGLRFLAERGVTVAVEGSASIGEIETIRRLDAEGRLPCRLVAQVAASSEEQMAELERSTLEFGQPLGPMSRVGAAKIFFDGFVMHRTARLLSPYVGEPGNRGSYFNRPERLAELVRRAFARGFPVAVHVTGDAGLREAAEIVARERERRGTRAPEGSYFIHGYFAPPGLPERLAALEIGLVAQPAFLYHWADTLEGFVGPARTADFYPLDDLLSAGVRVAAGSDAPVADPDPLLGLYAATTRRSASGRVWGERHRLEVASALRLYRKSAGELFAWSGFPAEVREGHPADLLVLDKDPARVPPDELRDVRVLAVVVGGRVVAQPSVQGSR